MTITIYQFADYEQGGGNPLLPAKKRDVGQILGAFFPIDSDTRYFEVHNNDAANGIRVRVSERNDTGNEATQQDHFIAAKAFYGFHVNRNKAPYVYAIQAT